MEAELSTGADDAGMTERDRTARLLRAASHDLRGPLANVRGYASLLAEPRMELPDKARKAVQVILRNADRALLLLREFMDSEQAERGRLELPVEAVSLREALDRALKASAPELDARGVRLSLDEQVQTAVLAEPSALEHILRVLIEHAAERSPSGNEIRLCVRPAGAQIQVIVLDFGPPLSAEQQRTLFDREAHLSQRPKLATGFRLSLASHEARLMEGSLEVASSADGTELSLRLPAAPT